ncbi:MAG: ATP-dependent DNA helicase Rep, partial [Moraxella sp.]|nr:ATP-dependent DNA helicase Rep [Moraxella sp.]
ERRLMYVGITRAREELTLSFAKKRRMGKDFKETTPSRFLDEIPHDHLDYPSKQMTKQDPKQVANNYLANIQEMLKQRQNK